MRATIVSGGASAMIEDNGNVEFLIYDEKWENAQRICIMKKDLADAHNLLNICKIVIEAEKT